MFSHLLLPIDGSAPSLKAAKAAIALAARLGARVTAYYAVDPAPYGFGASGAPADDPLLLKLERRALAAGRQFVDVVARAAEQAGVACETVVEVARPDEGIVAAARKRRCDGVFMSSQGRRGWKRLLLGSVASRVIATSTVPVIVYRREAAPRP